MPPWLRNSSLILHIQLLKSENSPQVASDKTTHWNRSDPPSLTPAGSAPIIEVSLSRRKAGHETLPIPDLGVTRVLLRSAATAQFGQSSSPGHPGGPGTQSEAGTVFHRIAQERGKDRRGYDQPGCDPG